MSLVRGFGAWTSGGVAAPVGTSSAPPGSYAPATVWTGHACTPENPCSSAPLPPACGPGSLDGRPCSPSGPTTAIWQPTPGQAAPTDGSGWHGGAGAPAADSPAPALPVSVNAQPFMPPGYRPPGTLPPAPASPTIFGLPPLAVLAGGGLLVFLIARRL